MTEPQEPSISPAAARMRRHRKRRRDGLRCLTVQLRETEIEALIHKGLLHSCHHEASDKSWSLLTMQGLKLGTVALWTWQLLERQALPICAALRCLPHRRPFSIGPAATSAVMSVAPGMNGMRFSPIWATPRSEPFRAASSQEGSKVFILTMSASTAALINRLSAAVIPT
jgi:hypothetical protein